MDEIWEWPILYALLLIWSILTILSLSFTISTLKRCTVCLIFMLCVFIYVYWCSTRFPYQMMFVSFNSNTPGATSGTGTTYPSGAPELTPGFIWGVCVAQSVVFCVVLFFRSLLSFCPFYFGHCLLFIDLRLLVTPLVPSNFSWQWGR